MAPDRAARPEGRPLRLFVAIDVPAEANAAVDAAFDPWRERLPRARWVPDRNRHVTLKFLGKTSPRSAPWVEERVGDAAEATPSFDARLTGVGAFPGSRRARVLWVAIDDGGGAMARVAGALDDALKAEFPPERRAFTPHLTVARSEPPVSLPEAFAQTPIEAVTWQVRHVTLYRSHLGRPAPRYEALRAFPLSAPRG
jgi:RNA 2',3'-cyclic 3'-phosphodiesterase